MIAQPWPKPDPAMFYGPIGAFAIKAGKYTEADPAAVLGAGLAYIGLHLSQFRCFLELGNAQHPPCVFAAIIGRTAKARKGTASALWRKVIGKLVVTVD